MANRDLLREAIADAKAVKEVAIANAKAALEEAFTPQLQSMLSEKINEMDELEESDLAEVDKEKIERNESKEVTDEAEELKEEELEEELDLEEILAELELEEETNEPHGNIGYNQEEGVPLAFEEGEDPMKEVETEMEEEMHDDSMKEAEGDDDAELDLENMTEDELQGFIEDVIEDMIEDGELVPGPNADESEAEEAEDTDDGMEGDADVDIEVDDIDLQEGQEEMEEGVFNVAANPQELMNAAQALGFVLGAIGVTTALETAGKDILDKAKKLGGDTVQKVKDAMDKGKKGDAPADTKLAEAQAVIKHLQSELNEVNLLNSKLLYTNKIFKAKNLTENQKIKVLKAFDKAETVKEAKVIFGSLSENLVNKKTKSNIKESMGFASKSAGVAPKRPLNEQVIEEDAMVSRFKQLAGIK
jgi:hypothetical protein